MWFLASDALKRAKATLAIAGDLTTLGLSADVSAVGARRQRHSADFWPFDERWLRSFALSADRRRPRAFRRANSQNLPCGNRRGRRRRTRTGAGQARSAQCRARTAGQQPIADPVAVLVVRLRRRWRKPGSARGIRRRQRSRRWHPPRRRRRRALEPVAFASSISRASSPSLNATRLAGAINGQLRLGTESPEGNVSGRGQGGGGRARVRCRADIATLSTFDDFAPQAHGGSLDRCRPRSTLGTQAFTRNASATSLDPAAFGNFPQASISGTIDARGDIKPSWRRH